MSRTKEREVGVSSPIKKIISYKPNAGVFAVYDKATKVKTELESIDLLIVDADRFSLSGYSAQYDAGFVSNTVLNTKKEPLTVGVISKGKYEEVAKGLYQDIKGDLEGGNYTKNVVALVKDGDSYTLTDLQLTGQARQKFQEWFNENESLAYESVVTLSASDLVYNYNKAEGVLEEVPKDKQKRWSTTWLKVLEFDTVEASGAEVRAAVSADTAYQKFLGGTTVDTPDDSNTEGTPDVDNSGDEYDDLPF